MKAALRIQTSTNIQYSMNTLLSISAELYPTFERLMIIEVDRSIPASDLRLLIDQRLDEDHNMPPPAKWYVRMDKPADPAVLDHHHHQESLQRGTRKYPYYLELPDQPGGHAIQSLGFVDGCAVCLEPVGAEQKGKKNTTPPICSAASSGQTAAVELLLAKGADIYQRLKGATPLHLAASGGHGDVVQLILDALSPSQMPMALTTTDNAGYTPLHHALADPRVRFFGPRGTLPHSIVERLLCEGNINLATKDGQTPLVMAIVSRRPLEVMAMLVESGGNISTVDKEGKTPLHVAADAFQVDHMRYLLDTGCEVDVRDYLGRPPLQNFINQLSFRKSAAGGAMRLFDENGASRVGADKHGNTLLHAALGAGAEEPVIRWLMSPQSTTKANKIGDTPLHLIMAAHKVHYGTNEVAIVSQLLGHGASVAAVNQKGESPLHIAAQFNKYESMVLLMAEGADVSTRDQFGNTPLNLAVYSNSGIEGPAALLDLGCDARNANVLSQSTALHTVAGHGSTEVLQLLLSNVSAADVDMKDRESRTPLHLAVACHSNREAKIRLLLSHSASPSAADIHGNTPLHTAIMMRFVIGEAFIRLLVQKDNVNLVNSLGKAALELAKEGGRSKDLIEMLVSYGAAIVSHPVASFNS